MLTSQVILHQTVKTISLWTWLCAQGHCNVGTGRGFPKLYIVLYVVALRFSVIETKGPQTKQAVLIYCFVGYHMKSNALELV